MNFNVRLVGPFKEFDAGARLTSLLTPEQLHEVYGFRLGKNNISPPLPRRCFWLQMTLASLDIYDIHVIIPSRTSGNER